MKNSSESSRLLSVKGPSRRGTLVRPLYIALAILGLVIFAVVMTERSRHEVDIEETLYDTKVEQWQEARIHALELVGSKNFDISVTIKKDGFQSLTFKQRFNPAHLYPNIGKIVYVQIDKSKFCKESRDLELAIGCGITLTPK